MIRTTRNEAIAQQAVTAAHPTSERDIARFVQSLRLGDIAKVEPVAFELYGTREYALDVTRLARAYAARGLGRGFERAVELAEARVARLNAAN